MQKKFITNLAFLLFLNILIKPFWLLGIDRAVQNATGAEIYGGYYALFNFSFLFNILLDLGITNFNNRNISQNRHLLQKHLSGIISLRLALAGLYLVVSLTAAVLLGYDILQIKMALILMLNQSLISFILYLRSNLAGLHLFKTDSIVSVLDRSIMIIICAWLLWGRTDNTPFQIEWFIWAQTVAYVITIFVVFLFLYKRVKFERFRWNYLFAIMILKKSYPFAILILLMTFYNRIDSVMLERMLPDGSRQAGIYAQAYRLMDAANMMAYLFAGLLLPMFAHMLKQKESITGLLRLSYSLIAVPAVSVAAVAFYFNNEVMDLLYHEHVGDSAAVFSMLMISFVAISTTYIFGTLLTANGNLKQLNLMATAGMTLNILLNFLFIPVLQVKGAAIASLITQFLTAGIQIGLCISVFQLKFDKMLIFKYITFALMTFFLTGIFSQLNLGWMVATLSSLFGSVIIALLIKLIDIKELMHSIRKEGR